MKFVLHDINYFIKQCGILQNIDISLPDRQVVGLIGPNGCGKSTLLKIIAGLVEPSSGDVLMDGVPIKHYSRKEIARKVAFVEQHNNANVNILVEHVVGLGRTPWLSIFDSWKTQDFDAVDKAIDLMKLEPFRLRYWNSLSGGEQQRTSIAQALAQETSCLILDEPTNHLDIKYQIDIVSWIRAQRGQRTMLVALHDLNHALYCCDQVLVLHHGRQYAFGPPVQIMTSTLIKDVFDVDATISEHPRTQNLFIDYYPS